jgi:hypothetical protein
MSSEPTIAQLEALHALRVQFESALPLASRVIGAGMNVKLGIADLEFEHMGRVYTLRLTEKADA